MAEKKQQQPKHPPTSRSGVDEGTTRSTDETRKSDRPVEEEDIFGGHERTERYQDVESGGAKP
jgi:hypothetical protein